MADAGGERRRDRPSGANGVAPRRVATGAVQRATGVEVRALSVDEARARERRRITQRARRRRRRRRNLIVAVLAVVVAVGLFFGIRALATKGDGEGSTGSSLTTRATSTTTSSTTKKSTTTTTAKTVTSVTSGSSPGGAPSKAEAVLLRLTQGDQTPTVLVLTVSGEPAVVLGIPGNTLLRGSAGFKTVTELLATGKVTVAEEALSSLLGITVSGVATAPSAALTQAAGIGGQASTSTAPGTSPEAAALQAAEEAAALAGAQGTTEGREALAGLPLEGEGERVRTAITALGGVSRITAALPGRLVEGADFVYYEPDTSKIRGLLGSDTPEKAIQVEVQNGSGAVGVAEAVGALIAGRGYTLLATKNADKFPNVATTQLYAAVGSVGDATRIRDLLQKGKVVRQDSLPEGKVIVVVGKDLPLESVPKATQ